jgi:tellurite resistance protein TerC
MSLYPFVQYWPFYLGFVLFVVTLLLLDLGVFHRKAHEVSFREASIWTAIWISLALAFNVLFYQYSYWKFSTDASLLAMAGFDPAEAAKRLALEFLAGFVVEKTLAIDNVFVFAVVFSYFSVPSIYQHRILFFGILGALIFRALFVALGSYLMAYQAVVIFFGVFLMGTGVKMFLAPSQMMEPEKNILIRILKRLVRIHPKIEGESFFVRKNGLLYATPLFLALAFVEISDIIFAIDSVPAIFALTKEPLIVFTSNIFAILGLRSMYFMLSGVMDRFIYIKYGLASVLVFVGLKMAWLNEYFGGKFPISWSLMIIGLLIGSSMFFSVIAVRRAGRAG